MQIVKLPKGYYKYADLSAAQLEKLGKTEEKEKLTVNLSAFIACKLEQYAVKVGEPVRNVLCRILIEEGVLDTEDVEITDKKKNTSKFDGVDCNDLKGIGTTKLFRINLSEYAKAKVLNYLVKEGIDLSFFVKKALVKKANKRDYQIIKVSEIDE